MTVVKTIGAGGGFGVTPDYTTIGAWFTYLSGLGAFADHQVGRVLWASSANELTATGQTTFNAINTNGFSCILEAGDGATGAAGGSFNSNANKATNALRYNAANGACFRTTGTNTFTALLSILSSGLTVRNLQFQTGSTGAHAVIDISGTNTTFDSCIFNQKSCDQHVVSVTVAGAVLQNCLHLFNFNTNQDSALITGGTASVTATNCTMLDTSTFASHWHAVWNTNSNAITLKNCAILGPWDVDISGTTNVTASYCATSMSSGASTLPGSNHQYSAVAATELVSVTNGSEDCRLASTSVKCRNNGTATGAPISDIVGQGRVN